VATKVITPQQPEASAQQPAVPKTKTVSIENLAASTTEQQLKSLCQGIGVLEVGQQWVCQAPALISLVQYRLHIVGMRLVTGTRTVEASLGYGSFVCQYQSMYEAHPQSKVPWGRLQKQNTISWKYLLQQIQQVFGYFSTYSPPELRHLSYRGTNF
jgi:hypothetical protein